MCFCSHFLLSKTLYLHNCVVFLREAVEMSKGIKQKKQNSFIYTLVATVLILAMFLVFLFLQYCVMM